MEETILSFSVSASGLHKKKAEGRKGNTKKNEPFSEGGIRPPSRVQNMDGQVRAERLYRPSESSTLWALSLCRKSYSLPLIQTDQCETAGIIVW